MLSLKELVKKTTIEITAVDKLDMAQVTPLLNEFKFAVIRGLVAPETVMRAKELLKAKFDPRQDRAATGEHPTEIQSNFQKLSIGGAEHSGSYRPRCMRTFYNPIWSEDIYGLREPFRRMAQVRNLIYGFDQMFAIDQPQDGFWTAARLHHYPAGGGFLVSHKDNVVPTVQAAEGINGYFQPILVMSLKGESDHCDFSTGGGFFDHNGARYFFEEECLLGDIVVYSGAIIHGVADIDIHKPFIQASTAGRLAGFVTLYKEFQKKGQLDDYLKGERLGDLDDYIQGNESE